MTLTLFARTSRSDRAAILTFLLLSMIASISVAQQITETQKTRFVKLDSMLGRLDRDKLWMGSIAVAKDTALLYTRSIGFYGERGDTRLSSTPAVHYRVGSISKMFTAVMIMQLVEEKKLALTTPLAEFFPSLPNAQQITIRHLLTHHSGLHNVTEDSDYSDWMTQPQTEQQMLARFERRRPEFAPDSDAAYSNTNFIVLGYIIEKLTNSSYAEQLKQRITVPLGLNGTYVGSGIHPEALEATSYNFDDGTWVEMPATDMSVPGGAGAIVSTVSDLAKFISALFHDRLVSHATLASMIEITDGFGKGIFRMPFYQRYAYGHSGSIDGFKGEVAFFPDDSTVTVILSNGSAIPLNNIVVATHRVLFLNKPVLPEFKYTHAAKVALDSLKALEGTYTSAETDILVALKGKQLTAQAAGQQPFPLTPVSATEFVFDAAGIRAVFTRNGASSPSRLELRQGGHSDFFQRK